MITPIESFKNHFLIAMPGMTDSRFTRSVTYLCEHNEDGAMGLVINQAADMSYKELFNHLELDHTYENDEPLVAGGPVQKERGFVLHSNDKSWETTLRVSDDISITGSKDILADIANNNGPKNVLIALGYAGWRAGQLEMEITKNTWLTVPAEKEVIFDTPLQDRWASSAKQLGIDLNLIPTHAGHA